jgi:hypothetical protein
MIVRVLPPFDGAFPDTYEILSVDGTTAYLGGIPEGFANAFDFQYLVQP